MATFGYYIKYVNVAKERFDRFCFLLFIALFSQLTNPIPLNYGSNYITKPLILYER